MKRCWMFFIGMIAVAFMALAVQGDDVISLKQPLIYNWTQPLAYDASLELTLLNRDKRVVAGKFYIEGKPEKKKLDPVEADGSGTAFAVSADGHWVTCSHVVGQLDEVEIILDGVTHQAKVLGQDEILDLALLKVEKPSPKFIPFANSETVEVGEDVRAFGYPLIDALGESLKVTRGTISGKVERHHQKFLQLDVSINPGNSGGPLVTEYGSLLGVNNAKLALQEGNVIGFSIPSKSVTEFLKRYQVNPVVVNTGKDLKGPELVKQVAPAVALIKVKAGSRTINAFALDYRFKLETSTNGNRHDGPPLSSRSMSEAVTVNERGKFYPGKNDSMSLLSYIFDTFPVSIENQWVQQFVRVHISKEEEAVGPSFPPFGGADPFPGGINRFPAFPRGPVHPLFPRIGPNPGIVREKIVESIIVLKYDYRLNKIAGDIVHLKKKIDIVSLENDNFLLTGSGDIQFDRKLGKLLGAKLEGAITLDEKKKETIPWKLEVKSIAPEVAKTTFSRPAPRNTTVERRESTPVSRSVLTNSLRPEPLNDAEVEMALQTLKGNQQGRIAMALRRIASAPAVDKYQEDIAKELLRHYQDERCFDRPSAVHAMGYWGSEDHLKIVRKELEEASDVWMRRGCILALGRRKDKDCVKSMAKLITDNFQRNEVINALHHIDPASAQAEMLPYLQDKNVLAVLDILKYLREYGTKSSLPALEKLDAHENQIIKNTANEAVRIIKQRGK
jgi:S1-C subfamily serine protease